MSQKLQRQLIDPDQLIKFKFISTQSYTKYLKCPLCQKLMIKPMRFHPCGHTFCYKCINHFVQLNPEDGIMLQTKSSHSGKKRKQKKTQIQICPYIDCNAKWKAIQSDRTAEGLIDELKVICINQECVWKGSYDAYKKIHKQKCVLKGGLNQFLMSLKNTMSFKSSQQSVNQGNDQYNPESIVQQEQDESRKLQIQGQQKGEVEKIDQNDKEEKYELIKQEIQQKRERQHHRENQKFDVTYFNDKNYFEYEDNGEKKDSTICLFGDANNKKMSDDSFKKFLDQKAKSLFIKTQTHHNKQSESIFHRIRSESMMGFCPFGPKKSEQVDNLFLSKQMKRIKQENSQNQQYRNNYEQSKPPEYIYRDQIYQREKERKEKQNGKNQEEKDYF